MIYIYVIIFLDSFFNIFCFNLILHYSIHLFYWHSDVQITDMYAQKHITSKLPSSGSSALRGNRQIRQWQTVIVGAEDKIKLQLSPAVPWYYYAIHCFAQLYSCKGFDNTLYTFPNEYIISHIGLNSTFNPVKSLNSSKLYANNIQCMSSCGSKSPLLDKMILLVLKKCYSSIVQYNNIHGICKH